MMFFCVDRAGRPISIGLANDLDAFAFAGDVLGLGREDTEPGTARYGRFVALKSWNAMDSRAVTEESAGVYSLKFGQFMPIRFIPSSCFVPKKIGGHPKELRLLVKRGQLYLNVMHGAMAHHRQRDHNTAGSAAQDVMLRLGIYGIGLSAVGPAILPCCVLRPS